MRFAFAAFALVFALGCVSAAAATVDSWQLWLADLKKECPSRHLDLTMEADWDELLGDFLKAMPEQTQLKIKASADYGHRCTDTEGFSCEMGVYLDAFYKLDLLNRFTAFGCRTWRCSDVADCGRTSN